jgi:hypothetical protein
MLAFCLPRRAASGDGVEVSAEFGAAALFADRFDRRPAHQP